MVFLDKMSVRELVSQLFFFLFFKEYTMIRGNLNFTEVQNVQVESESTEIGYFNTFVQAPLQRRVRP